MLSQSVTEVLLEGLDKLKQEINAYATEDALWVVDREIANSGGTLALHICGNLQHFIGHVMGETDYERDREAEFENKHIPRVEIVSEIDNAASIIESVLSKLEPEDLENNFPIQVFKHKPTMTTAYLIVTLASHLSYHLGQINYHRRLTAN